MNETIDTYIKAHLKPSRYAHSLGVAQTAQQLAERFGADPAAAYRAGLLHDAAKYMPTQEAFSWCEKAEIVVDEYARTEEALLHAPAGAALAKLYFKEKNPDVINAVRYHTVGSPAITLLGQIIFLADFIEPTRATFPALEHIRTLAHTDLDAATVAACDSSLSYVMQKGGIIHPDTVLMRNALLMRRKKDLQG